MRWIFSALFDSRALFLFSNSTSSLYTTITSYTPHANNLNLKRAKSIFLCFLNIFIFVSLLFRLPIWCIAFAVLNENLFSSFFFRILKHFFHSSKMINYLCSCIKIYGHFGVVILCVPVACFFVVFENWFVHMHFTLHSILPFGFYACKSRNAFMFLVFFFTIQVF